MSDIDGAATNASNEGAQNGLAKGAAGLLELLNYIEQVEKLKIKPAFSVPPEFFAAYEHELKWLPELRFNLQSEGDDVWLRVPRLKEIGAPELDEPLRPWVVLPKTPEKNPELKHEIVISDGRHETGRKRIEDHPEISELFTWYVEYQWKPWATAERPRRQTIARYNKLFSLQQAISSEGAETPLELVWGIGYSVWKKQGFGTAVSYPLLIQACEVSLNEKTFDLEVRPRDIEARLDADCYAEMGISGVKQLEAYWRGALASGANRVNPFEPSTFEGTLKAAVGHLGV